MDTQQYISIFRTLLQHDKQQGTKMAMLRKVGGLTQTLFMKNKSFISITRKYSDYADTDYDAEQPTLPEIPGPYPRTKEEWLKAAEKYHLHPDEYKPFPPDHRYTGDYPDLPMLGVETRDQFYPWDYPASRRNYGEPLHKQFDMMGEDRYAFGERTLISDAKGSFIFFGVMAVCVLLFIISPETSQPMLEKQYPGGVHYTFETVK